MEATMKVYYYGGELYHHGVKGQKWGVRRYQNPDGTLTDEGKKHYINKSIKNTLKYENASTAAAGGALGTLIFGIPAGITLGMIAAGSEYVMSSGLIAMMLTPVTALTAAIGGTIALGASFAKKNANKKLGLSKEDQKDIHKKIVDLKYEKSDKANAQYNFYSYNNKKVPDTVKKELKDEYDKKYEDLYKKYK